MSSPSSSSSQGKDFPSLSDDAVLKETGQAQDRKRPDRPPPTLSDVSTSQTSLKKQRRLGEFSSSSSSASSSSSSSSAPLPTPEEANRSLSHGEISMIPMVPADAYQPGYSCKTSSSLSNAVPCFRAPGRYQLVAPAGFGKTSFGLLWLDFFAGKSDRFWWNDGLKGRCSLNAGKYLCKSLDLEGCASLEDIERRLSLILGDLYDFDLQTPKMTRKSEGSHQLVLFVENFESVLPLHHFKMLLDLLLYTPQTKEQIPFILFASTQKIDRTAVTEINVPFLGYTMQDLQALFPGHLVELDKLPQFQQPGGVIEAIQHRMSPLSDDEPRFPFSPMRSRVMRVKSMTGAALRQKTKKNERV